MSVFGPCLGVQTNRQTDCSVCPSLFWDHMKPCSSFGATFSMWSAIVAFIKLFMYLCVSAAVRVRFRQLCYTL